MKRGPVREDIERGPSRRTSMEIGTGRTFLYF